MNRSLLFGLIGLVVLVLLIAIGPALAPYEMSQITPFEKVLIDGKDRYVSNPLPPSSRHLLGTDMDGHDELSILLRGARVTVTFALGVALVRVLFSIPLAYLGTMLPRTIGWLNEKASVAFTTVPAVLIVALTSSAFILSDAFQPQTNLFIMCGLIALVGLFPTAYTVQTKMESILLAPFMEGQLAIGSGRWRILRKHLLPHLTTYLSVLFVSEIAHTLWLIGQLGVLHLFIGGTKMGAFGVEGMMLPEEWAGTIGWNLTGFAAHPSMVLVPAFALAFAIFSFNFLADGIRQRNERKWGIGL